MGVIVKGMNMPKCCDSCYFGHWSNLHQTGKCGLNNEPCFADYSMEYRTKRPDWCLLVELPNTDLVDADTVEFWGEHEHGYRWTGKIVVHREKENEND